MLTFMQSSSRKLYRELAAAIVCTFVLSVTAFTQEVQADMQAAGQESVLSAMSFSQMPAFGQDMGGLAYNSISINGILNAPENAQQALLETETAEAENENEAETSETEEAPVKQEPAEAPAEQEMPQAPAEEAVTEESAAAEATESAAEPAAEEPAPAAEAEAAVVPAAAEAVVVQEAAVPAPAVQMTPADYEALCRIVEAEATGGTVESKRLVANVVLNRVESEKFPNTVQEVVFQRSNGKTQFSPVANGRYHRVKVTPETMQAVNEAIAGVDGSMGALYFKATYSNVSWFDNSLTKLYTVGGHDFYR